MVERLTAKTRITPDMDRRLNLFGACSGSRVGKRLEDFSQTDLIWAEKVLSDEEKTGLSLPLWVLAKFGYGYGSGSEYGDEYGSGYGSGDEYGDGYGYGKGNGSGTG